MRLLKIEIKGAGLFANQSFSMDFFAADRVAGKDGPNFNNVHRIGSTGNIYSQNVISIGGVNASGKTTALKLIKLALDLLQSSYDIRSDSLGGYKPAKLSQQITVEVIFWQEGVFYLLESVLDVLKVLDDERETDWFRIADETIWALNASRPNKAMMASPAVFKENASIFLKRNGDQNDKLVIPPDARKYLRDDVSMVIAVTAKDGFGDSFGLGDILHTQHATDVVHAFDASVELLAWDEKADAFRLKFHGEPERMVSERSVLELLSEGTIVGIGLVEHALDQLKHGGFLLIDEIEYGLNKSLIKTFIELFQSHATNPYGAQLIFTTHYVELLDYLPRKDNVYLLVRAKDFETDVVKYSNRISRIENKKSEVVLANAIKGAMPSYPEVEGMRAYAREYVCEQE